MNISIARLTIVVLAITSLTVPVSSQTRTILKEEFTDNTNQWFVGSTDNGELQATVQSGVYSLKYSKVNAYYTLYQKQALPQSENWTLTARMRQVRGEKNAEFGIIFNGSNAHNVYILMVRSDGAARLVRYKEGAFQAISEFRSEPIVHGVRDWVTLEVRRRNDALACYVNGIFVGGLCYSYFKVYGPIVGFYISEPSEVEADNIQCTTFPMEQVHIVEGIRPDVKPERLPITVNSEADELVDCIVADGSVLVFSRNHHPENTGTIANGDIWWSERDSNGAWQKAVNLGPPLNNASHNFAVAVTQDLNTLFIQGLYRSDGTSSTSGGISMSTRTKTGWSEPIAMLIKGFYNYGELINSHISPDGTVLVMSVQRKDTRGGNDLYVSFRTPENDWSEPLHMGDELNSLGMETGPFIAADGRTLYFSSDGHPGFEGRDIFVSTRLDDSWTTWTKPKNLGKPINSDEHDSFFQVTAQGDQGYYSSNTNAIGRFDIFQIALPSGAKPQPVTLVKGRVLDAVTKEPVQATVVYEDLATAKRAGTALSSPTDGSFRVALVHGAQYGVHAEAQGYYPLSEVFDTKGLPTYTEQVKDLLLSPLSQAGAIRLNNVFFDHGKHELRDESSAELQRLAQFLMANPDIRIELAGHTDNVGSDTDNLSLSQNRVNAVKEYLVRSGINAARLTAKGYGESRPIAPNTTEEGRQQNRRVDFTILK